MLLLAILLTLIILYFLAMSLIGLRAFPRIAQAIADGLLARSAVYRGQIAGLWVPAALVLLSTAFQRYSLADLGLMWFRPGPGWLVIAASAIALLYLAWLLITLFAMRSAFRQGRPSPQPVPERLRPLFPVTAGERRLWACTALTAGFTEELLFRGFLFYALAALFPGMPAMAVLLVATALFGLGHLYQGPKEALQPMALGLLLGILYLAFGTIWPCVILHVLQDLCVVYAVGKE